MGTYWAFKFINEDNTATFNKTNHYIEEGTIVTVTANDGYVLDTIKLETPFYTETVPSSVVQGKQEVKFNPRKYIRDTATTKNLTMTVTTSEVEAGQVVTYTYDLDDGLYSKFDKDVVEKTDVIEIGAKDYYRFKGNIEVTLNDTTSNYNLEDNELYFRDEGKTFALRMETKWRDDLESVHIKARSESFVEYDIQVSNAVSNYYLPEVQGNEEIIVSAKENYDFRNGVTVVYTRNGINERINYTPKNNPENFSEDSIDFYLNIADVWTDDLQKIEVIANAEEIPPAKEALINFILENNTSNITGKYIKEDEDLVLTADEGFEFGDLIKITITRQMNVGTTQTYLPNSASDSKYFNDDNTVFTLNMSEIWDYDTYIILVEASAKESYKGDDDEDITDSSTDFANIYYADSGILSNIASERFSKAQTGGLEGQGDLPIDMGSYIYQVYKFPLKFTDDLISESESKIRMGFYPLESTSRYMLRSRVKFDLGTITVPETYNNIYDYRDTECLLHVPYAEPIDIDPSYVIGQMVDLAFFLDLYNGTVTLEVYSDKIAGGLVQRVDDVPLAFDIPFMQPQYNSVLNRVGGYINNKVKTPYIEVVRNIPYDQDTIFGKEGKEYGRLNEFEGYVEVADLDLSTNAKREEQEQIESLLNQGVIINKPQEKTIITE